MAKYVDDYVEQAGQVSRTDSSFSGTTWKKVKFIREKISDHMDTSQPAFTIPSQSSKWAGPLPCNCNPGGRTHQMR